VPQRFGKILFAVSTITLAVVIWILAYIGMRYLGMVFPGFELHIPATIMFGIVLGSYSWLVRWFWKTKLARPRPCDPYSSLGLSSEETKLRGRR
jgi:hypothetical protein